MVKIPKSVLKDLERKSQKTLKNDYKKTFKKNFDKVKEEMIQEFLSDPVTVEILSGPSGANISGTLNGVANLFAFIGFNSSDKPIDPILDLLNTITYKDSGESDKGRKFNVIMPTPQDVFSITPMPWATGRSWAKGIETGISGLGYLLNKSSGSSRSGVAIQAESKVRGARFNNRPYISALLKKYKKKFKDLS
ncbi:MAG: hypothetical protein ACO3LB_08345 [Flavobacteriaceae bacterium]